MSNQYPEGQWFVGIVVNVSDDPNKLGYMKIRIPVDDDGRPDDQLPWAYPLLPVTSASHKGIGISPTGIEINSQVFGMYLDGRAHNERLVLGTIPAIREGDDSKHDVSKLARGIGGITKQQIGPEPASSYDTIYPFNKVHETKSGHVIEIDDTPSAERIHIYHKSGTYIEISNDGRTVIKSVGDSFNINAKNNEVFVQGNMNIVVKGDVKISVDGKTDVSSKGKISVKSDAEIAMNAPKITITEG